MNLAERLKERREKRRLRNGQVALYLGITTSYVSQMENGKKQPSLEVLTRLAKYYDTTTDYLLGLSDDPSPRRDAPLPEVNLAVLGILDELSEGRRAELLAHARVLYEAEQTVNVREYRRMRAMVLRMPDGKRIAQVLDDALRAGSSGDLAAALAIVDAYLAELPASDTPDEESEQM